MMNIKEHQQVLLISFFDKKTGSRMIVNEQLAEELYKQGSKNSKEEKSM